MWKTVLASAVALTVSSAWAQHADRVTSQPTARAAPEAFPALTLIYRASGLRDNGRATNAGVATSIHCTNLTTTSQRVQYVLRDFDHTLGASPTFTLAAGRTHTSSTHGTVLFNEDVILSPGQVYQQGLLAILATNPNVICSVHVVDAAAAIPHGIDLHLVRYSAAPGTQE